MLQPNVSQLEKIETIKPKEIMFLLKGTLDEVDEVNEVNEVLIYLDTVPNKQKLLHKSGLMKNISTYDWTEGVIVYTISK